jgi:hypothetical protein
VALILSNPAHADKFTDTIDIYKKSEAVQPFSKMHMGMRFFRPSAKPVSGVRTARARFTRVGKLSARSL